MLTLEQCRELLGPDCAMSDQDIALLRDQLYAIADLAIVRATRGNNDGQASLNDGTEGRAT